MNKKQIAKLLIQHPEIKALYESREFDASTINKIIAEEVIRETKEESYLDEVKEALEEYEDLKKQVGVNKSIIEELEALDNLDEDEKEDLEESKTFLKEAEDALEYQKQRFIQVFKDASTITTQNWTTSSGKKNSEEDDDDDDDAPKIKKHPPKKVKEIESIVSKARKALEELNNKPTATPTEKIGKVKQVATVADTSAKEVAVALDNVQDVASAASDNTDVSASPVQKTPLKLGGTSVNKIKKLGQALVGFSEQQSEELIQKLVNLVQATDIKDASDTKWEAIPEELKIYDSALSLFTPTEDNGIRLNPEVLSITPLEASEESVDAFVIKKEELETPEIKQEIENINKQVEKAMNTNTSPSTRREDPALKSLRKKLQGLIGKERYQKVLDIMTVLSKPDATIDELTAVWPNVTVTNLEGMQAIANEPTNAISKAIAAAQGAINAAEGGSTSAPPEEVAPAVDAALDEIDTKLKEFNNKTAELRTKALKKIAKITNKDSRAYERMNVMQSRNFIIFLIQQMAKNKKEINEDVKSAMTNKSQRALAIKAIEANKEEVESLAQDLSSSFNLAKAIREKFGVEIRSISTALQSPEAILKNLFAKWKEAGGNVEEFKEMVTALSKKHKDRDGETDIDKIENVIEKYLADNSVSFDSDTPDESDTQGDMSDTVDIIASTLQGLGSSVEQFPKLMANEEFKQLLSSKLQSAIPVEDNVEDENDTTPPNSDSDGLPKVDTEDDETVEEGLSGIFLTEDGDEDGSETDVVKPDSNVETPSPLSPEDATLIYNEVVKLKEVFGKSETYKEIDVMNLATRVFGPISSNEELPDENEAATDGQSAAEADDDLQDARYEQLYAGFKTQLDKFFGTDGKRNGFMDQFLLKHQSRELATLLSVLQDIIRGDIPDDDEDNEGEARALSSKVQQSDAGLEEGLFGNKEKISKEGKIDLQTSLVSMLKGIKSLKAMMNAYAEHATRSSANPMLDGSSLKKSLNKYMTRLQVNIASIIERCEIEQSRLTQSSVEDIPVDLPPENVEVDDDNETVEEGLSGIFLTEEDSREDKLKIVNNSFSQMLTIYETSLSSSLEKQQTTLAINSSRKILEFAKDEKFFSLFPSFVGVHNGAPQTINQAIKAVAGLMKEFVETMKKVVLLSKGETIDETTLIKVVSDLENLSITIENYFGIKSQLDPTIKEKVGKLLAQEEGSEAISDNSGPSPESADDEQGENAFIRKLRELFPNANKIVQNAENLWAKLSSSVDEEDMSQAAEEIEGSNEDDVGEALDLLVVAQTWLNGKSDEEHEALTNFANFIIDGLTGDELSEGQVTNNALKSFTQKDIEKLIEYALDRMVGNEKVIVVEMLENEDEDFANFITAHLKTNPFAPTLRDVFLTADADDSNSSQQDGDNIVEKIKPYVEILNINTRVVPAIRTITTFIGNKFGKVDDQETMKQLLCCFILYSLPSETNEAAKNSTTQSEIQPNVPASDNTDEQTLVDVFLGNIKKHVKLSKYFNTFISQNSANIKNVLANEAFDDLFENKPIVLNFRRQLGKDSTMRTIIDQLKKGETDEDAPSEEAGGPENSEDSSAEGDSSIPPETERDEEKAAQDPLSQFGEINDPELIEKLVVSGKLANDGEWSTLDADGVKNQLEKIATNIPEDENKIKELQNLFLELAELLQKLKQVAAEATYSSQKEEVSEGLKDAWNTVKTKVKTATNNFKSKSDLPDEVETDLKKLKDKYPVSAKDIRHQLTEFISKIRNTGIEMRSSYKYVISTLYDEYDTEAKQRGIGNLIASFDSESESMKFREKNRREMNLRAQYGDQIDESTHKNKNIDLQKALRPIIEKMLKEYYNH